MASDEFAFRIRQTGGAAVPEYVSDHAASVAYFVIKHLSRAPKGGASIYRSRFLNHTLVAKAKYEAKPTGEITSVNLSIWIWGNGVRSEFIATTYPPATPPVVVEDAIVEAKPPAKQADAGLAKLVSLNRIVN